MKAQGGKPLTHELLFYFASMRSVFVEGKLVAILRRRERAVLVLFNYATKVQNHRGSISERLTCVCVCVCVPLEARSHLTNSLHKFPHFTAFFPKQTAAEVKNLEKIPLLHELLNDRPISRTIQ